jgi:hypothetical protein
LLSDLISARELLDVDGDLGTIEHDDPAPHGGHEALLAIKVGVVCRRKPEPATSG